MAIQQQKSVEQDPIKQKEILACYWEAERLIYLGSVTFEQKEAARIKMVEYEDAAIDLGLVAGWNDPDGSLS